MSRLARRYRAWGFGIRDGWHQPLDLSTSTNVDHLAEQPGEDTDHDVLDALDRGINLGQLLRAGRKSQAWRERWFKVIP
jgi:hypothetical protein